MTLQRAFQVMGVVLVGLMLLGCGSDGETEDDEPAGEEQQAMGASVDDQQSEATSDVPVMSEAVVIETEARLDNRRQMQVSGTTNLPEGAQLQVMVERESSRVRWRSRVNVSAEGDFEAGPFGPGSGLPDGMYLIEVSMPPANVQPASVRERIGERGEHLEGELVREANHGLGYEVRYRSQIELGDQRSIRYIDGS
ncbi:hypothetical protein SAMN05192555_102142 [Franzmannia pantelleriensis]|uniref:Lipoprotein n=1 Tax=Franzmannia pantelleriensis TaxID=48727 RepID=A0A1G9GIB2_9GAMM|nr:hypothetical protein [Halomonas pantelleriensis]SDL00003.1 hypothetical protein SAMN05192555_102142 [Halomonas pantelleriensis]